MTFPNQKEVQIAKRTPRNAEHLYSMNNLDALRQAMICLKGSGLKMWIYLNKNQDNFRFGLSRVDCAEWGIRKDSYYDGIKDLIANGYLRQSQPGSNLYIFYENALTENPTSGYSEFYFTEKTKPYPVNQNGRYEIPKGTAVNPERNNINNTRIINDNKSLAHPENDDDYWEELERQKEREAKKRTWASYSHLGF